MREKQILYPVLLGPKKKIRVKNVHLSEMVNVQFGKNANSSLIFNYLKIMIIKFILLNICPQVMT